MWYGMVRLAGRHKSRKIPRHIAAELARGLVSAAGDVLEFRLNSSFACKCRKITQLLSQVGVNFAREQTQIQPGLTAKVSTDPGRRGEWRLKQTLSSNEQHMELVFGRAQVVTRLVGAVLLWTTVV